MYVCAVHYICIHQLQQFTQSSDLSVCFVGAVDAHKGSILHHLPCQQSMMQVMADILQIHSFSHAD